MCCLFWRPHANFSEISNFHPHIKPPQKIPKFHPPKPTKIPVEPLFFPRLNNSPQPHQNPLKSPKTRQKRDSTPPLHTHPHTIAQLPHKFSPYPPQKPPHQFRPKFFATNFKFRFLDQVDLEPAPRPTARAAHEPRPIILRMVFLNVSIKIFWVLKSSIRF